ncbi:MAG: hypothetical protein JWM21_3859 [Acidobacteria bacterium]|nr:hypothetical protein [Acidobacteriota bacterium]
MHLAVCKTLSHAVNFSAAFNSKVARSSTLAELGVGNFRFRWFLQGCGLRHDLILVIHAKSPRGLSFKGRL